jgi:plastocyanin
VTIRGALVLASIAVLGAAVVVLPTVALSETTPPGVVAENVGLYNHYWQPPSVTIEPGGSVEFSNPTGVAHGIRWFKTPAGAPACTAGVPVGTTETASGTMWQGTCTFAAAGTYTYYCTVHGAAMSGTITVGAPSSTPTGTSTGPTGTTVPTGTTPLPGAGPPTGAATPTAGSALSTLRLGSAQHGTAVRGSLTIASTAAGGTLTVVLQAKLGGHRVQVGRLTRAHIAAGRQSWSIALSAKARRALRARGHLALLANVSLTAPGGSPVTLTRTLALHR